MPSTRLSHHTIGFDALARQQAEIGVDEAFAKELYHCNPPLRLPHVSHIVHNNFSADMVLSIGGDGTFLHTAARIGDKCIPILGINTGRLGFLTDLSGNDIDTGIQEIFKGHYRIENRSLLHVETQASHPLSWPYALNEIAILKQDSASMISIRMYIDGEFSIHTKPTVLSLPLLPALPLTLLVQEAPY